MKFEKIKNAFDYTLLLGILLSVIIIAPHFVAVPISINARVLIIFILSAFLMAEGINNNLIPGLFSLAGIIAIPIILGTYYWGLSFVAAWLSVSVTSMAAYPLIEIFKWRNCKKAPT